MELTGTQSQMHHPRNLPRAIIPTARYSVISDGMDFLQSSIAINKLFAPVEYRVVKRPCRTGIVQDRKVSSKIRRTIDTVNRRMKHGRHEGKLRVEEARRTHWGALRFSNALSKLVERVAKFLSLRVYENCQRAKWEQCLYEER